MTIVQATAKQAQVEGDIAGILACATAVVAAVEDEYGGLPPALAEPVPTWDIPVTFVAVLVQAFADCGAEHSRSDAAIAAKLRMMCGEHKVPLNLLPAILDAAGVD